MKVGKLRQRSLSIWRSTLLVKDVNNYFFKSPGERDKRGKENSKPKKSIEEWKKILLLIYLLCYFWLNINSSFQNIFHINLFFISTVFKSCQCYLHNFLVVILNITWVWFILEELFLSQRKGIMKSLLSVIQNYICSLSFHEKKLLPLAYILEMVRILKYTSSKNWLNELIN